MRMFPAAVAAAFLLFCAPSAYAGSLTLGSDLTGTAAITVAQGADTAFWANQVKGAPVVVPEDGQVTEIRVKGAAKREPGASTDPATLVHFQSLDPAAADGSRHIYLTSGSFHMPVVTPNATTVFKPENLCVKQGGAVAFNTIGGFRWGGSLDAPLSNHYTQGTPWQIFAAASTSSTNWYSKDEGTKNGMTLNPSAGGPTAAEGIGGVHQGNELLMQVVVATGDDRTEPCGGPRRHPDGTLVDVTPEEMHMTVTKYRGKPQTPYVASTRKFAVGIYCGGETQPTCDGVATVHYGKKLKKIATANFSVAALQGTRVSFTLPRKQYNVLHKKKIRRLPVTFVMTTAFGVFKQKLTLIQ